jgi:hypothetical protein
MYAFFTFLAFIFESLLNVSEVYSMDEPAAQIKCLPSKIPIGIFYRHALKNEAQRRCIGIASGQF